MNQYKIVPFEKDWYDPSTGWLTGALQYAMRVPEDEIHTGLFTDSMLPECTHRRMANSEAMRFEIQQNLVIQTNGNRQIHITQFEVKVFDLRDQTSTNWQETWARYMDGIKPVWVKESANINYKFKIPKNLMPVNQAAFFRKAFRDLRALHSPLTLAAADTAKAAAFQHYCGRMGINLHRLVGPLKNPDGALTPTMADFCLVLNEHEDGGPINVAQARKLVRGLTTIWFTSTGQLANPNERGRPQEDIDKETDLIVKMEHELQRAYPNPKADGSK